MAVSSVPVGQLWQAGPRVALDVLATDEKSGMQVMKSVLGFLQPQSSQ